MATCCVLRLLAPAPLPRLLHLCVEGMLRLQREGNVCERQRLGIWEPTKVAAAWAAASAAVD